MPVKVVIFDIDNTLLDWSQRRVGWFADPEGHIAHLAKTARVFEPGISQDKIEALVESFKEEQRNTMYEETEEAPHLGRMLARHLHKVGITSEVVGDDVVLEAYNWTVTPGVEPFPDVLEVLPILREHHVPLGIITNGYQPISQRDLELEAYGLLQYISECRFSSADVGVLKPDARIFKAALDCMGVMPDEAVYVGDNPVMDVIGAQRAGMKGVWRLPEGQDPKVWSWVKPDAIIDTLHDLLPILEKWMS